jgi:hypothetical protein
MDYRTAKQAIYGGIYLVIFLSFCVWFYFLVVKPAPTCFDKKHNQNEEGVDCGGSCAQICLPANLQPVSLVDEVQVFSPVSGKATLLARLKNPNEAHGALVSYVLTIYDEKDQVVASLSQKVLLYPSQVRYIIVPSVNLEDETIRVKRASLRLQKVDWQLAELMRQPQVAIRDHNIERDGNFLSVSGNVTNSDIMDISQATIIAVFFNQFNIAIGAARTELPELRSGETRSFNIIHPMLPSLATQRTQIFLSAD